MASYAQQQEQAARPTPNQPEELPPVVPRSPLKLAKLAAGPVLAAVWLVRRRRR